MSSWDNQDVFACACWDNQGAERPLECRCKGKEELDVKLGHGEYRSNRCFSGGEEGSCQEE